MSTTTHTTPAAGGDAWLTCTAAAELLGVPHRRNVLRLALAGLVTTRQVPGARRSYYRPDLEAIAATAVRAASHGGPTC
jgi:hypothetical protein